jgi:hypothetical protein
VLAATVEKAGLALMIGMQWKNPDLRGLRVAAVNDAICVLLYLTYLFGLA